MRTRRIGDSDLEVTEIGLGSWLTYSGGVAFDQTTSCTRAGMEAGITFYDTANVYGQGAAEAAWGQILADYDRASYVLATKVFFRMSDAPEDRGLSAAQIQKQIDASLQRLRTDYVDLYQCHRFDPYVPIEETMEALGDVVRSGKARYIGFSEWTTEQIRAALAVPGAPKLVSSQPQYSALWQGPERELFPLCAANGISQVVWSPLAEGLLTGKYQPGQRPPEDSRAASESMGNTLRARINDELLTDVQRLGPIAEGLGLSVAQLALAWVLRRPEVASAIIGASRPEQIHENIAASGVELSSDVVAAIDEALGASAVRQPYLGPFAEAGVLHR